MTAGRTENKTIFTVVDKDDLERLERTVTSVLGDLRKPNTGIMVAVPVCYFAGFN